MPEINLDAEQLAATRTDSRQALVLAGPGSGKTRCITERAAWLIEERNVAPSELLLVTFTRFAANEMRTRLKDRIGRQAAQVQIGTFHATALSLLRRFGDLLGYKPKALTVYSEHESDYLLKEVATDLGVYNGKSWNPRKGEIIKVFDRYYQEGFLPKEDHPARRVFEEFNLRCFENNSLSYGGLMVQFRKLIPEISQYLHWKHLILDEGHDADRLQIQVLKLLQHTLSASIYVVLDLDQTLYSWRGACPDYWLDHQAEFDIFPLVNNYRSCKQIVEPAGRLIEHNQDRIPRPMVATRTDDGTVKTMEGMDTEELYTKIFRRYEFDKNTAVLARSHFLLKKLTERLEDEGIPYSYIGRKTELLSTDHFCMVHALLKLIVNPFDNFSFLVVRNLLGVSRKAYNEIRLTASQEDKSHFQVWYDCAEIQPIRDLFQMDDGPPDGVWSFSNILDRVIDFLDDSEVDPFLTEEALSLVREWRTDTPNGTLAEYLAWLATYAVQDEIREEDERMKLLSVHQSKGLEFNRVILVGLNEGILPSRQSVEAGDGEIEAERRIMFVACTRAKDTLILAVRPEQETTETGRDYSNPRSRFIAEMQEK
ncbi:MAG: ATP-dependent helicase [Pseudomonadota bacterium]